MQVEIKPITWPEERMPTSREWVDWFMDHEDTGRVVIAELLLDRLHDAAGIYLAREELLQKIQALEKTVEEIKAARARA